MQKVEIVIDPSKVNKEKIQTREYEDKLGTMVKKMEYKMDLVPLKEPKTIYSGNGRKLVKKFFIAESQTKEERESGGETNFLGDGLVWEDEGIAGFDDDEVKENSPF